jgi:hypothetical protein
MASINNLEKLRPCGRLETYSTARHHLGFYNNVAVSATYTSLRPPSVSLETSVFAAIKPVIAKHPTLSAIVLNEHQSHPNVYFARLPKIDLRACIHFRRRSTPFPFDGQADGELNNVLSEQHGEGFKDGLGRKPFWRLIVLTSSTNPNTFTALWMFHHALADGTSALLFHESFLSALNALPEDADPNPIITSPTTSLPPPCEELHPMPLSWSYFLTALAKNIFPSIFDQRNQKLWTGNRIMQTATPIPHFNYRSLAISAEATKKLTQMCKHEKTSVTATLQCLLAAAILFSVSATQFEKVKITGPISMRRFLDIPSDQMTNAVTEYKYMHQRPPKLTPDSHTNVPQNFSWDEARSLKSTIEAEVAKEGRDNEVALLKYVSNIHTLFTERLGKERDATAELSNLGVWKGKAEGRWWLGRMTFSQCPNPVACPFGVSAVTGGDGNVCLTFCWSDGAVDEGFVERVVEEVERGVSELVGKDGE